MSKAKTVDPGTGNPEAPAGTEEWAQSWRMLLQFYSEGDASNIKFTVRCFEQGLKYRAWTLVTDKHGNYFTSFKDFVYEDKPWGLGFANPDKFIAMMELELGKKVTQLETVAEPQQGKRTDLKQKGKSEESTSCVERNKSDTEKQSRIRAINRAPSVVGDLYRQGLINQTEAAKLGKKGSDTTKIAKTLQVTAQKIKSLPKKEQRKKVNEVARELAGTKEKTPLNTIKTNLQKVSMDDLVRVLSHDQRNELAAILKNEGNNITSDLEPKTESTTATREPAKPKRTQPPEPQHRTARVVAESAKPRSLSLFSDFNLDAPEGTLPWARAITHKCGMRFDSVMNKAGSAFYTVERARKDNAWRVLGFDSFDDWFEAEIGFPIELYQRFEVPVKNESIEEFVSRLTVPCRKALARRTKQQTRTTDPVGFRDVFGEFVIDAPEGTLPWANTITHNCRISFESLKDAADSAYRNTEKAREGRAWEVLGHDNFESWFEIELQFPVELYEPFRIQKESETVEEFVRRLAGRGYATEERDEMLAELAT